MAARILEQTFSYNPKPVCDRGTACLVLRRRTDFHPVCQPLPLFFLSRSLLSLISLVRITGTFLPRFPRISTISSLKGIKPACIVKIKHKKTNWTNISFFFKQERCNMQSSDQSLKYIFNVFDLLSCNLKLMPGCSIQMDENSTL